MFTPTLASCLSMASAFILMSLSWQSCTHHQHSSRRVSGRGLRLALGDGGGRTAHSIVVKSPDAMSTILSSELPHGLPPPVSVTPTIKAAIPADHHLVVVLRVCLVPIYPPSPPQPPSSSSSSPLSLTTSSSSLPHPVPCGHRPPTLPQHALSPCRHSPSLWDRTPARQLMAK
jgi:hypothetical protein